MKKTLLYRLFVVLGDYESSPYAKAKRLVILVSLLVCAVLLCLLAFGPSRVFAQSALNYPSAWECDTEKWHWYCDAQPPAKAAIPHKTEKKKPPTETATPTKRVELKDIKSASALREELKRREDKAIMEPTAQNVRDFLEAHTLVQTKSSDFADVWRRVVWTNPDLDYSLKHPVNNTGIRLKKDQREKETDEHMIALAKEHGLLFFFRSDCPYCHAMAPVLEMIEKKYGMEIFAVSTDNAPLPGLSKWSANKGQFETLLQTHGLREARVPALFIASKQSKDTAPLGMGVMAYTEIIDRIFVLTGTKVGEDF
jgi:conjugal transfer pilus assembly protein TraF